MLCFLSLRIAFWRYDSRKNKYIMSWKLPSRAFKKSLGTLSASRGLHLIRFGRHVSYIILVNDAASEGSVEVLFLSMKFSFVCHEYWRMTHMHHDGWNLRFEHRGFVFGMIIFCVEWMTCAMAFGYVGRFP
jgi:hypothetical protein